MSSKFNLAAHIYTGERARSYIIFTYNKANSSDFGVEIDFARLSVYLNRNTYKQTPQITVK